jgi:hypothetical protein
MNTSEKRNCQNCHQEFTIEPEDFDFYKKIDVPPPTWCSECRQMRRYSWRNERNLYRRNCDKCGKSTVTIYHPDAPYTVYCHACWWSDVWNAKDFGMTVDVDRPFFEQFRELQLKVPRVALLGKNSINSEYTNHSADNKNVYLSFDCFNCENGFYMSNCWNGTKDSCDVNLAYEGGEFLYECFHCDRCFKCEFCLLVDDSIECKYCFDCVNCQNCFLSWNLRNKKYCFRNEQLTKEEYEKKISELALGSYKEREELYAEWKNILEKKSFHKYAQIVKSQNISGDVIHNSRNVKNGYYIYDSDNVRHSIIAIAKDSMDLFSVGLGATNSVYESHALTDASNVKFCHLSYENAFIEYCDSCHNSQNLFGCIGLRKGEYCILNKQYTKEEYESVRGELINKMTARGEYGEFFPQSLSPFGYNETHGDIYMPMTKEDALAHGFRWQDNILITKGKGTLPPENIPDNIRDINDAITKEALTCVSCSRNYNVVLPEVTFYKRMDIPVPRRCPECRYRRRIGLRPPRRLWHRQCMKPGCTNEFETSYAPERPEIVYCESCYQQEVI